MLNHRHASHLLGLAKPDPAIFRRFEELTDRHGNEILFFDDRSDNINATRALGWHAEQINPEADTAAQIAEHLGRYRVM